ncbi:N-acetylmuramoyl-l-alanine amidase I [Sodalis praecaptivus]|uniref:N-acetylmuramoyl-L-alanine amidase AmiA n=1 Tax=Sodalis praecaptivus TaxID=1239307 RepID=W0HVU0_9GAMM|nr:N-acetylmuramoyl-L-alanine amidase AmiA [Sodalis praecaptivus]AHF76637.1 N-acetylmuramoyl-l-alanine amidase I [Sodalis praecaptivus]
MNPANKPPFCGSRRRLLLTGMAMALFGVERANAAAQSVTNATRFGAAAPRPADGIKRVVLDPGHGGIDSGAVGQAGAEEKHVVLEIAHHIRALLARYPHIQVHLTRETDYFIPLAQRVDIAHQHGADLFMSIHADGYIRPSAHGASVFALSTRGASSAMARYLSQKENAADLVGGNHAAPDDHYLQQALFDLVQTDTINNSLLLGKHLLNTLRPVHTLHSQTTEQAAFAVLKSPSIPSVLVETSFITNPQEERLLGTTAFRQKIAGAIADGIVSFFAYFDAHARHRGGQ